MARSAEAVRQLAHHLYADEPLVEERCAQPGVGEVATGADRAYQDRGFRAGLDVGEGTSGCGRVKKTGRKLSANPAADGTPGFIWLPRMLERQ